MKRLALCFFLVLSGLIGQAQNHYIYRGSKRFSATAPWEFKVEGMNFCYGFTAQVARTGNSGFIVLTTGCDVFPYHIGGNAILYLDGGRVITCIDRGIRDKTNGNCMTVYNLTATEMATLSSQRIRKVRFSLVSNSGSRGKEAFVAENKKQEYVLQQFESISGEEPTFNGSSQEASTATEVEIAELMN